MRQFMNTLNNQGGSHAGLVLNRYLPARGASDPNNSKQKEAVFRAALEAVKQPETLALYNHALERWTKSLPSGTAVVDLTTNGKVITGIGIESVLEVGIRLNHIYGFPLIPGSSLKGIAAHYCAKLWGEADERFKKRDTEKTEDQNRNAYELIFGATDDRGCIIFHDAWYVSDPETAALVLDVMTPHHPEWLDGTVAPTDFDSPIPVPFLAATGKFRVAVSWNGPPSEQAQAWTALALGLVLEALANWGVGAKTSSGYGRMSDGSKSKTEVNAADRRVGAKVKVAYLGSDRVNGQSIYRIQEPDQQPGAIRKVPPGNLNLKKGVSVEVVLTAIGPPPEYRWV